jgi:hypothetical protein
MADVKISELPVAVSVAGADLLAIVQGGVTKQATFTLFQAGFLAATNNLSDVDDAADARSNLDVMSSAEVAAAISSAVTDFVTEQFFTEQLAGVAMIVGGANNPGGGTTTFTLQSHWETLIFLDFDYTPDYVGGPDVYKAVVQFPAASGQQGRRIKVNTSIKNQIYQIPIIRQTNSAFAFKAQNNSNNWKGLHGAAPYRSPSDAPSSPGNEEDEYLGWDEGYFYIESDGSLWQVYYGGIDYGT